MSRLGPDRTAVRNFNLVPRELIARARGEPPREFVDSLGSSALLLIDIGDAESALSLGLLEASAAKSEAMPPSSGRLGYGTRVGTLPIMAVPPSMPPKSVPPLTPIRLQTLLIKRAYFAAPLVKRVVAGKPFSERVSVGRARNNDVVLRHASISKFHAWFELDEDEQLFLGDARSTNGTRLNGRVLGREMEQIRFGDEIQFGDVVTTLCSGETLCEALRQL